MDVYYANADGQWDTSAQLLPCSCSRNVSSLPLKAVVLHTLVTCSATTAAIHESAGTRSHWPHVLSKREKYRLVWDVRQPGFEIQNLLLSRAHSTDYFSKNNTQYSISRTYVELISVMCVCVFPEKLMFGMVVQPTYLKFVGQCHM